MNRRSRRTLLGFSMLGIVTALAYLAFTINKDMRSPVIALSEFHTGLEKRYPDVRHMPANELANFDNNSIVLFDVREKSEFDTSRLKSAVRIAPNIDAEQLLERFEDIMHDKTVVFYCSVGERSSKLAEAVAKLVEPDKFNIVNLEGGIFKWHNEQRPVFNSQGLTTNIHPFNAYWGRLLLHKDDIHKGS